MLRTCPHLAPLEKELEARGVTIGEGSRSPYGDLGIWYPVDCTFDEAALRTRLHIGPAVSYEEYDGRVAGSDATWFCSACQRALMGIHPRYANARTIHID